MDRSEQLETTIGTAERYTSRYYSKFGWPLLLATLLLGLTAALSFSLYESERHHLRHSVEADAGILTARLKADIQARVSALHRLAGRWASQNGLSENAFLSDAHLVFADFPGFQALQWIDSDLVVRWIEPLAGNEVALGIKSGFEPRRLAALERSWKERVPTMTSVINLLQGGKGFLFYLPLFKKNEFDGFLLAVFRLEDWLHFALQIDTDNALGHLVEVSLDNTVVYKNSDLLIDSPPVEANTRLNLYGHDVMLKMSPTQAYWETESTKLYIWVGLFGTLVSLLAALVLYLWRVAVRAAREEKSHKERLSTEIVERKDAQKQLHQLAYYDVLTGVASRRLAMEQLQSAVTLAEENASKVGVLYIDIDGFKSVNDTWGHEVGDQLLCKVALVMKTEVGSLGSVGRLGGDEFLVILDHADTEEKIASIANEIMRAAGVAWCWRQTLIRSALKAR